MAPLSPGRRRTMSAATPAWRSSVTWRTGTRRASSPSGTANTWTSRRQRRARRPRPPGPAPCGRRPGPSRRRRQCGAAEHLGQPVVAAAAADRRLRAQPVVHELERRPRVVVQAADQLRVVLEGHARGGQQLRGPRRGTPCRRPRGGRPSAGRRRAAPAPPARLSSSTRSGLISARRRVSSSRSSPRRKSWSAARGTPAGTPCRPGVLSRMRKSVSPRSRYPWSRQDDQLGVQRRVLAPIASMPTWEKCR